MPLQYGEKLTRLGPRTEKVFSDERRLSGRIGIMKGHAKKLIAPVIIVIGISLYYVVGGIVAATLAVPIIVKIIAGILSILVSIMLLIVLIERIKEVQIGEEDDLGKY